jgi:hypothetical protein
VFPQQRLLTAHITKKCVARQLSNGNDQPPTVNQSLVMADDNCAMDIVSGKKLPVAHGRPPHLPALKLNATKSSFTKSAKAHSEQLVKLNVNSNTGTNGRKRKNGAS